MKTSIMCWIILCIFLFVSVVCFAQLSNPHKKPRIPAWVSDKGFWVIETNGSSRFDHTLRFYDTDNNLVYSERLSGVHLNTGKRRVKMKLKKILETALVAYKENKVSNPGATELSLVRTMFP